jgi:hypothetical protein
MVELDKLIPNKAYPTLAVHLALDGNNNDEVKHSIFKA